MTEADDHTEAEPEPPQPPESWWYTLQIPAEPTLIGLVRDSVHSALQRHDRCELSDTACLLTTELVTNGVLHAKSSVTVDISWREDTFRVAVHDLSRAIPRGRPLGEGEAGRGLAIVEACSAAWGWGINPAQPGKTVWFELHPTRGRDG